MSDAKTNKERALAAALTQIERQFGKGSMMRLGDQEPDLVPSISTGSLGSRHRTGRRRPSARSGRGNLRSGIIR